MKPRRSLAAAAFLLLLPTVTGAEGGDGAAEDPVGGVVLGEPEWRRSHFSANAQGYYYPSHLVPRSWAGGGDSGARGYRSGGYTSERTYDARRHHLDRRYARDRYFRNRRYANQRY
jgi:hypothetical protein